MRTEYKSHTGNMIVRYVREHVFGLIWEGLSEYIHIDGMIKIDVTKLKPDGRIMNNFSPSMINSIITWIRDDSIAHSRTKWVMEIRKWLRAEIDAYNKFKSTKIPEDIVHVLDKYFDYNEDAGFNVDDFLGGYYRSRTPKHSSEAKTHTVYYPEFGELVRLTYWYDGSVWIDSYKFDIDYTVKTIEHHYEIEQKYMDVYVYKFFKRNKNVDDFYKVLDSRSQIFMELECEFGGDDIDHMIAYLKDICDYEIIDKDHYIVIKPIYPDDAKFKATVITIESDGCMYCSGWKASPLNVGAVLSALSADCMLRPWLQQNYSSLLKRWGTKMEYKNIYIER